MANNYFPVSWRGVTSDKAVNRMLLDKFVCIICTVIVLSGKSGGNDIFVVIIQSRIFTGGHQIMFLIDLTILN